MHFPKLSRHLSGCGYKANFPARHMVGFTKAGNDKGTLGQVGVARHAFVLLPVVHHVFIHLVADEQDVGWGQQLLQCQHIGFGPDGGAGVVRRVDDDGTGFGGDGAFDFAKIGLEGAGR